MDSQDAARSTCMHPHRRLCRWEGVDLMLSTPAQMMAAFEGALVVLVIAGWWWPFRG